MNRFDLPPVTSAPRVPAEDLSRASRATETALSFLDTVVDAFISFFASSAIRTTLRAIGAALCFFGILFVIGAVETGVLTFGAGILASILLCAISFLLVFARVSRTDGATAAPRDPSDGAE